MRMWMLDPQKMCSQHLLGEHVEIHMLVGTLRKKKSIEGFILKGLLEVRSVRRRHNELVAEMQRRGFKHASPLPRFRARELGKVDRQNNAIELARRCRKCRELMGLS